MQKCAPLGHLVRHLLVVLLGLGLFAGSSAAQPVTVKEVLSSAGKYSDRPAQVDGIVARWIELGGADKAGSYVLKDSFGDEIVVKMTETMPAVGERVSVNGLVVMDAGKKEYYLQRLADNGANAGSEQSGSSSGGGGSALVSKLVTSSGSTKTLLGFGAIAAIVFIFILFVAVRMRGGSKKVVDIPDFSFDETATIKIDADGKLAIPSSAIDSSDECTVMLSPVQEFDDEKTVVLMPGFFSVTRGPKDVEGQVYRLSTPLTKVGREESSVDKSNGWITFPPSCATVSRYQVDLLFKDGIYYVENRSRTALTKVNGATLGTDESRPLNDNDVIGFGEVELTYSCPA